jgi:hypothetical protein
MDSYERNQIWDATWKVYYETYFQEVLAERLVLRWQRFDEFSKVLIALTASTSALSGWALWNDPDFKVVWAIFAGLGAILAITHKSLDVSHKLTDWGSSRSHFSLIRLDCEQFQNKMRFNPEFPIKDFSEEERLLHDRFKEAYQKTKIDGFLTGKLRIAAQKELDQLILNK